MDIHEYQAKQLISKFGVNVPVGEVIYQPHEAITVTSWLNEEEVVVKSQVHAGGRGKAGGIKVCKNQEEKHTHLCKFIPVARFKSSICFETLFLLGINFLAVSFKDISSFTTVDIPNQPNAISGKKLKEKFKYFSNVQYKESIEQAIKSVPLEKNDLLIITGSLYLSGEFLNLN